eukprot:11298268-Alexandrium_andersonii.AAC.1
MPPLARNKLQRCRTWRPPAGRLNQHCVPNSGSSLPPLARKDREAQTRFPSGRGVAGSALLRSKMGTKAATDPALV